MYSHVLPQNVCYMRYHVSKYVWISLDFTCTYIIRVVEENVLDKSYWSDHIYNYYIACPVTGLGVTVITTISDYFRHTILLYWARGTSVEELPGS